MRQSTAGWTRHLLPTHDRACLQIGPLFFEAATRIYAVSPTTLIMVEGSGQLGYPGINYGDGFVTDATLITQCAPYAGCAACCTWSAMPRLAEPAAELMSGWRAACRYGLADPNPFFTNVSAAPFQGNMLLGPHVYPPSITSATAVRQARLRSPQLSCSAPHWHSA